jgi:hypothetical protein
MSTKKQTDAEHEWNNEGGQQPTVGGPSALSRQPANEARPNLKGPGGSKFKVTLSRLELMSLNQGLTLWLAELRTKTDLMGEADPSETEAIETAERLQERIGTLLGEQ